MSSLSASAHKRQRQRQRQHCGAGPLDATVSVFLKREAAPFAALIGQLWLRPYRESRANLLKVRRNLYYHPPPFSHISTDAARPKLLTAGRRRANALQAIVDFQVTAVARASTALLVHTKLAAADCHGQRDR